MSDRTATNNGYTLNENGVLKAYSADTGGYQTDVLSDRMQSFIKSAKASGSQPFFAYLAVGAPHTPTEPAARHLSAYPGATAPRSLSFNEADISDKPRWLQDQSPLMDAATIAEIDTDYRGSLQALLAVEDATEALFATLDQLGLSSNTYVFLTSDNGVHRGEHRLRGGKNTAYEESIQDALLRARARRARGQDRRSPDRTRRPGSHFSGLAGASVPCHRWTACRSCPFSPRPRPHSRPGARRC